MAYIQRKIPSPNKVFSFPIKDFSGGLNNASEILMDNESSDLLNMAFTDRVLMEKRQGLDWYDSFQVLDAEGVGDDITYLGEYKPYVGDDELIRASNLKVYSENYKIQDVLGQIDAINFYGRFYFVDGDSLYVYGKFPSATSTYVDVTGEYVSKCVMKVVNPAEGYTPLDTTHIMGVTRYNYDTFEVSYEPCQNELDDSSKGVNIVPSNPRFICAHNGRVFLSGVKDDNDNVFISAVERPFYFPVGLPMQIPPDSDEIMGLIVYNNSVVVGRKHDIYVIMGDTNDTTLGFDLFVLKKLNTHTGFASGKAVSVVNNFLFFLGSDGIVYAMSSVNYDSKNLITQIISGQLDLTKYPISVTYDDMATASAVYITGEWYLSIADKVLLYNYDNRAWTLYDGFNATSMYNRDNALIFGKSNGYVGCYGTNYLDYSHPYKAYWKSKNYDMDEPNLFKHFRDLTISAHTYEAYLSDIYIGVEIDYIDASDEFHVESAVTLWGKAKFGEKFINRNITASLPLWISRRGRTIRFTIMNGYVYEGYVDTLADRDNWPDKYTGMVLYVLSDTTFYLYNKDREWEVLDNSQINQRMKIHQLNIDFETRGAR